MTLADDKTDTTLDIADIMAHTTVRLGSAILNVYFSLVPLCRQVDSSRHSVFLM